jgi:hypothetical protein
MILMRIMMMAATRRMWMDHPSTGKKINPRSHRTIRISPIVKSM